MARILRVPSRIGFEKILIAFCSAEVEKIRVLGFGISVVGIPIGDRPRGQTVELVRQLLANVRPGDTISIKDTIWTIRERDPHLIERDCELVDLIVSDAVCLGAFVAFDCHE
ncbi:hypothetical protein LB515_13565 [Mesorhizobium sp. CA15]|uniref:hypothetical protein n=1 Tax=Mesorhizobium sp. CA15 TaxID=2876641 RepID=UPI001CD09880|nr:hypothetical protein [Mesorhizobium sp. CA15]MBZ9866409.1 hypothetical protein [Mesorhizobium sp. CA15]